MKPTSGYLNIIYILFTPLMLIIAIILHIIVYMATLGHVKIIRCATEEESKELENKYGEDNTAWLLL